MFKHFEFNYRKLSPHKQGLIIIGLTTVIGIICLIAGKRSVHAWNFLLMPLLLFCFYNPVLAAFQQKPFRYMLLSFVVFIVLIAYIYIIGNYVSEYPFKQAKELHTIAILIPLFYCMFYFLCMLFRGILHMLREIDN